MPSNNTSLSGKSQNINAMVTFLIFASFPPSIRATSGNATLLGASKISFCHRTLCSHYVAQQRCGSTV